MNQSDEVSNRIRGHDKNMAKKSNLFITFQTVAIVSIPLRDSN